MAKRYKRKTARSGLETVVNLLALLLFAVLGIGFVAALFFTHMLTPLLLAVIAAAVVVAVVVVFALRFSRGPAKRTAGSVLSVVFCLVFAVGIVYARVGLDTLDRSPTRRPRPWPCPCMCGEMIPAAWTSCSSTPLACSAPTRPTPRRR